MSQSLCDRYKFDDVKIAERLDLTGLSGEHNYALATQLLTNVLQPNVDAIVDEFYRSVTQNTEFNEIVHRHSQLSKLKLAQRKYLLSLGRNYGSRQYFEDRLKVGAVHQRVGVPLSLYHSCYCLIQNLLIDRVPAELTASADTHTSMIQFILRITSLDMSLAIEAYCSDRIASLEHSLDSARGEEEELRKSLRTDSLTQLYSRNFVLSELKRIVSKNKGKQQPLCVAMTDLDHFKKINDRYGHLIGDQILRTVAIRMTNAARNLDTLGRYGGEEFMLILEETDLEGATSVCERIRQRIVNNPVHDAAFSVSVSMSFGIAELRIDDDTKSLVARADEALYAAKKAGRNCVRSESDIDALRHSVTI